MITFPNPMELFLKEQLCGIFIFLYKLTTVNITKIELYDSIDRVIQRKTKYLVSLVKTYHLYVRYSYMPPYFRLSTSRIKGVTTKKEIWENEKLVLLCALKRLGLCLFSIDERKSDMPLKMQIFTLAYSMYMHIYLFLYILTIIY